MNPLMLHPGFRLLRAELALIHDLVRLFRGFTVIPDSAVPLPATQGLWFLPVTVSALTVVEITAVELLVTAVSLRVLVTAVSVYSLLLLWGLFGRQKVFPHYVYHRTLVLRQGRRVLVDVPLEESEKVIEERSFTADRLSVSDQTLFTGNGNGTNVRVDLRVPVPVTVPGERVWEKRRTFQITSLRFWADDPQKAVTAIRCARS